MAGLMALFVILIHTLYVVFKEAQKDLLAARARAIYTRHN